MNYIQTEEKSCESVAEDMDIDMDNRSPTSSQHLVDAATETSIDTRLHILQRKLKTLQQKVRRRDVKISNMKQVLTNMHN